MTLEELEAAVEADTHNNAVEWRSYKGDSMALTFALDCIRHFLAAKDGAATCPVLGRWVLCERRAEANLRRIVGAP